MADMDDGSMGSRRSALAFGIVAAISIVLLIVIGVTGENVGPNTTASERRVVIPAIRTMNNVV